jgi:hypothetical protein
MAGKKLRPARHASSGRENPLPRLLLAGRRKSTPAALDMALRTAEGRAAIEELANSGGKKQMVFGQYFGAPAGGAAQSAVGAHPDKATTRFMKAAAMASTGPSSSDKHITAITEVSNAASCGHTAQNQRQIQGQDLTLNATHAHRTRTHPWRQYRGVKPC